MRKIQKKKREGQMAQKVGVVLALTRQTLVTPREKGAPNERKLALLAITRKASISQRALEVLIRPQRQPQRTPNRLEKVTPYEENGIRNIMNTFRPLLQPLGMRVLHLPLILLRARPPLGRNDQNGKQDTANR